MRLRRFIATALIGAVAVLGAVSVSSAANAATTTTHVHPMCEDDGMPNAVC